MSELSRRAFLRDSSVLGAALFLAGCATSGTTTDPLVPPPASGPGSDVFGTGAADGNLAMMYGPVPNEKFPIAAVDLTKVDPAFLRAEVDYWTEEQPGTIVVDPTAHYLYHVQPNRRAMRYGVGVGKQGFEWTGTATINSKQEWPDWYPPAEMIARRPDIQPQLVQLQSGVGVPGGLRNPIGARGLYLWQGGKDTLYRIHGTTEPHTIGQSVSSGCIRMINQDVIHLYDRVPVGTEVKVLPAGTTAVG
jgi:lipoprotein-anchoring transpeptidase ErfK/SrfK